MTAFQSWQLADSRKGHIDFSFLKEIYSNCMHMPKSKSELSSEEVSLSCITNNTFVYNTLVSALQIINLYLDKPGTQDLGTQDS